MTGCKPNKFIRLDDLQIADWISAIRTAILQLENEDAWLVRATCRAVDIMTWRKHWLIQGAFLETRAVEVEYKFAELRSQLPHCKTSVKIAEMSEKAAREIKEMSFAKHDKLGEKGHLHLVAFSKAALCIVPEMAVVNDRWVRKFFEIEDKDRYRAGINQKVAEAFETAFPLWIDKINEAVEVYLTTGSKIPDAKQRLHEWTDLTLKRRVLDVAIMMAAGRPI
jgi:hypothetical protein